MDEEQSKGGRVLFTAIIIACVLAILMEIYHLGYAVYTWTDDFSYLFGRDNFGYTLYNSSVLSTLSWIFSYAQVWQRYLHFIKHQDPKRRLYCCLLRYFCPKSSRKFCR